MRRSLPLYLFLAAALLASIAGQPALAEDNGTYVDEIEETRAKLQQTQKREQSARSALSRNQRELNSLNRDLNTINRELATAQQRALQAQKELAELETELLDLEGKLAESSDLLRQRVLALYKYGTTSYLEIVLSATSFDELITRYELSGYIIRRDLKAIEEYRATYREMEVKQREILDRHEELTEQKQAIAALQNRAAKAREKKAAQVQMTQAEVRRLEQDRVRYEAALDELESLSRQLGEEMRRQGSGAALGTGKLMWPARGRISSPFGWRTHPITRTRKFHGGIDIAIPSGTPVLAADNGVVVIAGWNGGYGYLVAIDHGRGRSTFYGHNSQLLVKKGDVVVKGQRISLSGSTGLSTGPHLHFEVRNNGEPANPLSYLPK